MKKFCCISIICCIAFACNTSDKNNPKEKELLALKKELGDSLNEIISKAGFNGLGVAIVNDKEVLFSGGYGFANADTKESYTETTIQNIASVSKTFIGIAALKAQEMGKLRLDDSVNQYLPFKVINPNYPGTAITLRHLLTHTSGINDNEEYLNRAWILYDTVNLAHNLKIDIGECKFSAPATEVPMENFLQNILTKEGIWYKKTAFTQKRPGEIFQYSNMGATLAALVIEKATGEKYDAFTTKYILKPLKMDASGWHLGTVNLLKHSKLYINKTTPYPFYFGVTYPDGNMITSSTDMSRYMLELMKGYFGNGTLLSKESYKTYFTEQLKAVNFIERTEGEYSDEYNMGITMGFSSTGNFGHSGGDPGLFSLLFFNPKTKIGKYIIVNTDVDKKEDWDLHYRAWALLDKYGAKLSTASNNQ